MLNEIRALIEKAGQSLIIEDKNIAIAGSTRLNFGKWNLEAKELEEAKDIMKALVDYLELDATILQVMTYSPAQLIEVLEALGYVAGEMTTNGWQMDFFQCFGKKGREPLMLSGCAMTRELKLQTTSVEEALMQSTEELEEELA